ncbi:hypothetical protein M405DRAFT_834137 [Rhizopogon salebrosus TDB-379]|nr:hypothetical protein M405DRAFT_834137 [Rhizopogon salebrosus TDB-379]
MPCNGQFLCDYAGRMLRKSCAPMYALFKHVRCEPDQFTVRVEHNHIASVSRLGDFSLQTFQARPKLYDQYVCMLYRFITMQSPTGSGAFERKTAVSVSGMLSIQVISGSEQ